MSDPPSQGEDEFEGTQDSDNESFGDGELPPVANPTMVIANPKHASQIMN